MLAVVFPQPADSELHGAAPDPTLKSSRDGPQPSQVIPRRASHSLYKDDATQPLPCIDITRTFAGKLCGRADDPAFNAKLIAFTRRVEPFMNVIAAVYAPAMASLLFVSDVTTRIALGYLTAATGLLLSVYVAASLSWDVLLLILNTFEFWFLSSINVANVIMWNVLFHDGRTAAFSASGFTYAMSLCFDANIYTRRYYTRLLAFGSPALLLGVVLTTLRYPPDLHYKVYDVLGVKVDAVDVLVSGNLIITYFSAVRVLRSQNLVLSKDLIRSVICDMYHPTCHLVRHSQPLMAEETFNITATTRRLSLRGQSTPIRQFKLLHSSAAHHIDVRKIVWPRLARVSQRVISPRFLSALGILSHATTLLGGGWALFRRVRPGDLPGLAYPLPASVCISISFASAAVVFVVYVAHYQRQTVKRILLDLDAWFVLLQLYIVSFGVCDLVQWHWQPVLSIATVWIWCHWTIFLDAVPSPTRRRLAYSQRFARVTTVILVAFPIVVVYAAYFAPMTLKQHNRVIFRLRLGNVEWEFQLLGFLASKLFTLEVWMVRFFWRELLRPADAFKMIKRRVFYRVLRS